MSQRKAKLMQAVLETASRQDYPSPRTSRPSKSRYISGINVEEGNKWEVKSKQKGKMNANFFLMQAGNQSYTTRGGQTLSCLFSSSHADKGAMRKEKKGHLRAGLPVGVAGLVDNGEGNIVGNKSAAGRVVGPGQGERGGGPGGDGGVVGGTVDDLGGGDVDARPRVARSPDGTGEDAVGRVGAVSGRRGVSRVDGAGRAAGDLDEAVVVGLEAAARATAGVDQVEDDGARLGGGGAESGVVRAERNGADITVGGDGDRVRARRAAGSRRGDGGELNLGDGAGLEDGRVADFKSGRLPSIDGGKVSRLDREHRWGGGGISREEEGEEGLELHCDIDFNL